jgi:resuscitation-promoting factor RpfA
MSSSRDVQALFGRFGGDAGSYQEICMENEAHEVRGRWPLLATIGPRQVELPQAGAERYEPAAGELAGREDSQAVMRRAAPLFTRLHLRDVPPALLKETPSVRDCSESRFSPVPRLERLQEEAAQVGNRVTARAQAGRFNPAVKVPAAFAQRGVVTPAVPSFAQPGATPSHAPLKSLFGDARAGVQPSGLSARAPNDSERLADLFERLRGGALRQPQAEAQAQDHSCSPRRPWFLREASKGVSGL